MYGVRAANRGRCGFRQPEVDHLAFGDQVLHGAGDVFDRYLGIDAVLVEQVDAVGTQTL